MLTPNRRLPIVLFAGALTALALVGCTYEGATDNPLKRKLTWFSFLDGTDIRHACVPGAPDWFRLVYNGVYVEQVRAYELKPAAETGRFQLRIEVTETADLSQLEINPARPDLLKPWRPKVSVTNISASDADTLARVIAEDGVFGPPPVGLQMASSDFYWTVAACRNGAYKFNAYRWPSPRFEHLQFPKLLATWDFSGIPVNPPRPTTPEDTLQRTNDRGYINLFYVKVGKDGLNRQRLGK